MPCWMLCLELIATYVMTHNIPYIVMQCTAIWHNIWQITTGMLCQCECCVSCSVLRHLCHMSCDVSQSCIILSVVHLHWNTKHIWCKTQCDTQQSICGSYHNVPCIIYHNISWYRCITTVKHHDIPVFICCILLCVVEHHVTISSVEASVLLCVM